MVHMEEAGATFLPSITWSHRLGRQEGSWVLGFLLQPQPHGPLAPAVRKWEVHFLPLLKVKPTVLMLT